MFTPFTDLDDPPVSGFLHSPSSANGDCVVLTHGAGANCQSKLLIEMSNALAACGFTVLRFDLPFRRARPFGPPPFGGASKDRDGLRRAAAVMRNETKGRVFLGGHSYGGRQSTMLVAEEPESADGLLLLSYPLHPPRKPDQLRTQHFPKLTKPAFFLHGTRDPFGTVAEMNSALQLIPAPHALFEIQGAGHEVLPKGPAGESLAEAAAEFKKFCAQIGV